MIFNYKTLDGNGDIVKHEIEEKYNPDEIQYALELLDIYYEKRNSKIGEE